MGISRWVNDLQSLAADRRSSGSSWHEHSQEVKAGAAALREQEHEAAHKASFAARCEHFTLFANSLAEGGTADVGLLSGGLRALHVLELTRGLERDAGLIVERLELADASAHSGVLAGYGIQSSGTVDVTVVAKKAEAIGRARSGALSSSSTDEEIREYALKTARAVERFLKACR